MTPNNESGSRVSYLRYLRANKIPHEITYTNRSYKIKSSLGDRLFATGNIKLSGMLFIKKVRRSVLDLGIIDTIPNINYVDAGLKRFMFNKEYKDGVYTDFIEFDLNKAYWNSAHKLGIINDEIYKEGLGSAFSKIELLASLGSLAKSVRRRTFDGAEYSKSVILEDSATTRHLWDAISYDTDKCMQACAFALGSDFCFYWTDAVIFKNTFRNRELVRETMLSHGFGFKTQTIASVVIKSNITTVYTKEDKGHAKKPKRDKDGNFGREFTFVATSLNDSAIDELIAKYGTGL